MDPIATTSVGEIAASLGGAAGALIAIDGNPGSGKSTLAIELATILRIPCIHLDDFLVRNQGTFLGFLRYEALADALRKPPLIVEGICVLAVLARLGVSVDALVYVDRNASDPENGNQRALLDEVRAYEAQYQPRGRATIIYARTTNQREFQPMEDTRSQVDIAYIQAKTKLAMMLAGGGMLTLVIGLAVLLYGVTGQDQTLIKGASLEVSASGLGGVIMVTSVLWAFFAYKARPTYARTSESSEKYDQDARLLERRRHETSTMAAVVRNRDKP